MLITPAQLSAEIDEVVVLDARYYLGSPGRGRAEYDGGHIPGARFVDVDTDLASHPADGVGGRHPLPSPADWQETLRRLGILQDSRVVVYDQASSLAAGRLWWMLRDAGIDAVVLDGGYRAWVASGLATSSEEPDVERSDISVSTGAMGVATAGDVAGREGVRLIDVRAPERYRGEVEPIDRVPGRIPGAENMPAGRLQRPDGTFLPADEIRSALGDVSPDDILSCGSGITAAQVALAAAAAGLGVPRVYVGSYSDWISDPNRAVERG